MGYKCVVPYCRSGYEGNTEKVSMFSIPKGKLEVFERAIPRRGRKLTAKDFICAKHFRERDIKRKVETACYSYDLKIPRLADDAIPSIFPVCPKYLTLTTKQKQTIIQKPNMIAKSKRRIIQKHDITPKLKKCKMGIVTAINKK